MVSVKVRVSVSYLNRSFVQSQIAPSLARHSTALLSTYAELALAPSAE